MTTIRICPTCDWRSSASTLRCPRCKEVYPAAEAGPAPEAVKAAADNVVAFKRTADPVTNSVIQAQQADSEDSSAQLLMLASIQLCEWRNLDPNEEVQVAQGGSAVLLPRWRIVLEEVKTHIQVSNAIFVATDRMRRL